jgi:hypothetical protein
VENTSIVQVTKERAMPPIQPSDNDPLTDSFAEAREERGRYDAFLAALRESDPVFAEASPLMPNDMSEWQAAVYLLAGSDEIWPAVGGAVLHHRSLGPVIWELDDPRRPWSSSEGQVLVWSAHLWDADRHQARFPYEFDRYNFRRWITAVHLRGGLAPAFWCR